MNPLRVVDKSIKSGCVDNSFAETIKQNNLKNAREKAKESADKTIEDLSEKQAEAIELENIYLNLLGGKITEERAGEILSALGYKTNPNPFLWIKKKLKGLREWIIDAVKWLRNIGRALKLTVKEITVEIGLAPKVAITFVT